jgi:hypothetical protein
MDAKTLNTIPLLLALSLDTEVASSSIHSN